MIKVVEAFSNGLPSWLTSDKWVVNKLNNRGIDLANATYVPDTPPTSGRDKKMNDPNRLPVYRLYTSSHRSNNLGVFIPGLTDPQVYYNGNYVEASKLSGKARLSLTASYGYIDLTDSKNMKTGKQAARKAARDGMPEREVVASTSTDMMSNMVKILMDIRTIIMCYHIRQDGQHLAERISQDIFQTLINMSKCFTKQIRIIMQRRYRRCMTT